MDETTLKRTISKNIIHYRKLLHLTQSELAERINYSDKSVSKWERAEGIPDVFILSQLADFFGVTVNDMLCETMPPKPMSTKRKKTIVPILSIGLVWLIASIVFFILNVALTDPSGTYIVFIYAIPVSFIVALVFASVWWNQLSQFACISGLIWSLAVSLDITFSVANLYLIYLVTAILQFLSVFWYLLMRKG